MYQRKVLRSNGEMRQVASFGGFSRCFLAHCDCSPLNLALSVEDRRSKRDALLLYVAGITKPAKTFSVSESGCVRRRVMNRTVEVCYPLWVLGVATLLRFISQGVVSFRNISRQRPAEIPLGETRGPCMLPLKIEQLLLTHYVTARAVHPSRICPNQKSSY